MNIQSEAKPTEAKRSKAKKNWLIMNTCSIPAFALNEVYHWNQFHSVFFFFLVCDKVKINLFMLKRFILVLWAARPCHIHYFIFVFFKHSNSKKTDATVSFGTCRTFTFFFTIMYIRPHFVRLKPKSFGCISCSFSHC